jgi:Fur family zinc uptake transcriptional regulator
MISKLKNDKEIKDSISRVFDICKNNNIIFTEIRKSVYEIIIKYNKPIKAYEVLDELRNITGKTSHPPTVYRAIDFLIENGFIHKLNSINSFVGCFHPKIHKECYFLICKKCNIYQECCDNDLAENIFKTAKQNDFIVSNTTLEIEGHCQDCLDK